MAKKQLKKCSISLVTKEIQIKTTLRFHLTPTGVTKIKKKKKKKKKKQKTKNKNLKRQSMLVRLCRNGNTLPLLVGV
jgi:hypothetical protein